MGRDYAQAYIHGSTVRIHDRGKVIVDQIKPDEHADETIMRMGYRLMIGGGTARGLKAHWPVARRRRLFGRLIGGHKL